MAWTSKQSKMMQPDLDYVCPDIQIGSTAASAPSDVFSFGQLVCALFTGTHRRAQVNMVNWSAGHQLVNWSAGQLVSWSAGHQLVNWSAGQLVSWSAGHQLVISWSTGQLVSWSAGHQLVISWSSAGQLISWLSAGHQLVISW